MLEGWFESKEAKAKKHEAFEKTVFPLGAEHKEWITQVLADNFEGDVKTHVFIYLVVKESYCQNHELNLEKILQGVIKKQKIKWNSEQVKKFIEILQWDLQAESIEGLNAFFKETVGE